MIMNMTSVVFLLQRTLLDYTDLIIYCIHLIIHYIMCQVASSRFFISKGYLDECLAIANAKGWYGRGRGGKKARQGRYGRVGKKARPCLAPFPYRPKQPAS